MPSFAQQAASRRKFLQFLAGSPLGRGRRRAFRRWRGCRTGTKLPDPLMWAPMRADKLIKSPKEAINVFDFEPVCRKNVPPAHFGYMASGIDDEVTLRANREGFLKFQLRPRRLVDVSKVDMSVDILGVKYEIADRARAGRRPASRSTPRARSPSRKAAKAGNHLQILSTATSIGVEDVTAARGAPIWYQLYATNKWEVAKAMVTRAEKAGCSRGGGDGRSQRRAQSGDAVPSAAHRHPRLQRLPRPQQPAGEHAHARHVSGRRSLRPRPTRSRPP